MAVHAFLLCVTMCDKLSLINYREETMNTYKYEISFKRLDLYTYNLIRTLAVESCWNKHWENVNQWMSSVIYQTSWSTLVQVMACCLLIAGDYLNQCWIIVNKTIKNTSQSSFHSRKRIWKCCLQMLATLFRLQNAKVAAHFTYLITANCLSKTPDEKFGSSYVVEAGI